MEAKSEQVTDSETNRSGVIGTGLYWKYLRSGNSLLWIIALFLATLTKESMMRFADYWLKIWFVSVILRATRTDKYNEL